MTHNLRDFQYFEEYTVENLIINIEIQNFNANIHQPNINISFSKWKINLKKHTLFKICVWNEHRSKISRCASAEGPCDIFRDPIKQKAKSHVRTSTITYLIIYDVYYLIKYVRKLCKNG